MALLARDFDVDYRPGLVDDAAALAAALAQVTLRTGQYAKPLPSVFPGGWVGSACWVTFCLPSCPTCLPFPLPSCLPSTCPLPISSPAGIGFEDCSTPVMNISRTELAANRSFQLEHERVEPDQ